MDVYNAILPLFKTQVESIAVANSMLHANGTITSPRALDEADLFEHDGITVRYVEDWMYGSGTLQRDDVGYPLIVCSVREVSKIFTERKQSESKFFVELRRYFNNRRRFPTINSLVSGAHEMHCRVFERDQFNRAERLKTKHVRTMTVRAWFRESRA